MQFSEQWLRSYANPPYSSDELAARLTMAGLEVESVDPVAPPFSGVVVGEVTRVVPHPNADKLTVCEVEVGAGEILSIVCGASERGAGNQGAVRAGGRDAARTERRSARRRCAACSRKACCVRRASSGSPTITLAC